MRRLSILAVIVLLTLPLPAAASEAAITASESPVHLDTRGDRDCDVLLANHDDGFENIYAWTYTAVNSPDQGAFAERFTGPFQVCEIKLYLTQTGNQAGQTLDVFIWQDDATGNPGELVTQLSGVNPGYLATWPDMSVVTIPISAEVEGNWWVGVWGDWPGEEAGWYLLADENGTPGTTSRTRIAPGQGYPAGWNHPGIVGAWSNCRSLGIEVVGNYPWIEEPPPACGNLTLVNHDGGMDNAYAWAAAGIVPPEGGAFAEGFTGDFDICEVQLRLTQIGAQTDQTLDLFVWQDDHLGNPGVVLAQLTDIDPGPVAQWPEISFHNIELELSVDGDWWVGYRGNWPGAVAGWMLAADEDGEGGNSRTNIAPGQGYPIGWNHPGIVPAWHNCKSLGIEVIGEGGTGIDDEATPEMSLLHQNSPNPFNPSTTISFDLAQAGRVHLEIIDVSGRSIATLVDEYRGTGRHEIIWRGRNNDGAEVSSGVYLYRLDAPGHAQTRKMLLLQ